MVIHSPRSEWCAFYTTLGLHLEYHDIKLAKYDNTFPEASNMRFYIILRLHQECLDLNNSEYSKVAVRICLEEKVIWWNFMNMSVISHMADN